MAMAVEEAAEMAGILFILPGIPMAVQIAQADGNLTIGRALRLLGC